MFTTKFVLFTIFSALFGTVLHSHAQMTMFQQSTGGQQLLDVPSRVKAQLAIEFLRSQDRTINQIRADVRRILAKYPQAKVNKEGGNT
jgi:hypothetical protein